MGDVAKPLALPKLTARSVILSLLVSNHPAEPTSAQIARAAEVFDVKPSATRAALSRLTQAGDLVRGDDGYRLSPRLHERRRQVENETVLETAPWSGQWEFVLITESGRDPDTRTALRTRLGRLRLAELREGVWGRPANLVRPLGLEDEPVLVVTGVPETEDQTLVARLWDLDGWQVHSERLLALMRTATDRVDRFTGAAGLVRHLLTDPTLPPELLPEPWSVDAVRRAWADYQEEFDALPGMED